MSDNNPQRRRPAAGPLALLLALLLAACTSERAVETGKLLAGARDLGLAQDDSVVRRPVALAVAGGTQQRQADLYRPRAAAPLAALVLVPGVTPQGRDDPRLVAFARLLARARFTVLVPELPNLRRLDVDPADAAAIAETVAALATAGAGDLPGLPAAPPPRRVGLVAISYAAGPAVLAALRPETRGRLGFLVAIGGYYDSRAVVTFFTTGRYRVPGSRAWRRAPANPAGKWVFLRSNLARLGDPDDRRRLDELARRRLVDPEAGVADLTAGLGPEGRSVLALLDNGDPGRVSALIEALPAAVRADLATLDLSRLDLTPIDAPVFLLHGRDDAVIPYSESVALAAALRPGVARLTLLDEFAHVELGESGLSDRLRLFELVYQVLEERDRLAGGTGAGG